MSNELSGKIAVITGAASGIGLASAEAIMAAGATVVLVDRNQAALNALVAKFGGKAIAQVTDLLDADSCAAMIPEVLAKTGKIDILYCNAGTYIGGDLIETNAAAIDRMLNLNVNAVIKNVHAVLPHMIEQGGGDIVVTCSFAGHAAIKHEPVYSASKWALTSFTQATRRQINKHGIRIGQVSPGPVITALLADWPADMLKERKEAGALMDASVIANAVMFMLTQPKNVTIMDVIVMPTNVDA